MLKVRGVGGGRFYVPGQRPGSHFSKFSERLNVASLQAKRPGGQCSLRTTLAIIRFFHVCTYICIQDCGALHNCRDIRLFCQAKVLQIGQLENNGTYLPQCCATQYVNPPHSQGLGDLSNLTTRRDLHIDMPSRLDHLETIASYDTRKA